MKGARWLAEHVVEAERLVDEALVAGVSCVAWVEGLLKEERAPRGRHCALSVRTLFVALQLGAFAGTLYLDDATDLLDDLSPKDRARLGLPRTGPAVSYRQVCYLVQRVNDVLRRNFTEENRGDDARYHDFDRVFGAIAVTGTHEDTARFSSIAVDGTDIATWGTDTTFFQLRLKELGPGRYEAVTDENGELVFDKVRVTTDADAAWRGSDNEQGKPSHFGYSLSVAVVARDEGGPVAPLAAVAARLRPANFSERPSGLACVAEVRDRRGSLGDVLIDRGYTSSKDGKDFLLPVRALGGDPIFDLTKYQVGPSGTVRGALIVDGRPYSPSMPKSLLTLTPPRGGEDGTYKPDPAKVREYQQAVAARAVYALDTHGGARANGSQVFVCPGAAGKLDCPLRAPKRALRAGALPVLRTPKNVATTSVCSNSYPSFSLEDLPLYQRHIYGTAQWAKSYSRRQTSVETYFSQLKSAAGAVERGRIRVRGIVKTGLLVAFAMASTNRRAALAYETAKSRPTTARKHRSGRPRGHRLTKYREVAERARRKTPTSSGVATVLTT